MAKFLKYLGFIFLGIVLFLVAVGIYLNESMPKGQEGPEAERLADRMLNSLNKEAYDSINVLSWSFPRGHHFVWDKKSNQVNVKWDDYEVDLNTKSIDGLAFKTSKELDGDEKEEAIKKAWSLFANDSFWLVAPYKVRDPGTIRKLVDYEGKDALMITYRTGGVTPGDSYLWILDENDRPVAWKMWVSIIPIGGLKFTWEGWQQEAGAWFAPLHKGPGPASVDIKNLQAN